MDSRQYLPRLYLGNSRSTLLLYSTVMGFYLTNGLKLSPIQQQIHRVDIGSETQMLSLAFKEAYAFIHSERLKQSDGEAASSFELSQGTTSEKSLSEQVAKLKASIDRWSLLEEKLQQTIAPSSSKQYKQAVEEANQQVAASRALLGQLYLLNRQEFIAVQELQAACPSLWEYDVAIRSQYFDGWVDCYAALGHLYVKIGNTDAALDTEREMLHRMPWMSSLVAPVTAEGGEDTADSSSDAAISTSDHAASNERPQMAVLLELWSLAPLDRLGLADQTRRLWMCARTLRAKLNELVAEFVAASSKRVKLKLFLEAQELLETELTKFTNSAASAAMVSDAMFSANTPSLELLERMSHQDFSQNIGTEQFAQLQIKSRMAEFIRVFKMQLFAEAKLYFEMMDGVIEQGEAFFLQPAATDGSSTDGVSASESAESVSRSHQQFASAIGFQSREAVRLTFEYSHMHSLKQQNRDTSKSSRSHRARRETPTANKATRPSGPSKDDPTGTTPSQLLEQLKQATTLYNLLIAAVLAGAAYVFLGKKQPKKTTPLSLEDLAKLDWIENDNKKKAAFGKGKDKEKKSKLAEDKKMHSRNSVGPAVCVNSRGNRDKVSATNLQALSARSSSDQLSRNTDLAPATSVSTVAVHSSLPASTLSSSNLEISKGSAIVSEADSGKTNNSADKAKLNMSPSMESLVLRLHEEELAQLAESEGEWTELPSGGAAKGKHMKAVSEKKLGREEQRERAVNEYRLKQQLELKLLDAAATSTAAIASNTAAKDASGSTKPAASMQKSNSKPSLSVAIAAPASKPVTKQPSAQSRNNANPTRTAEAQEISSNEVSPKTNMWAARRRDSKVETQSSSSTPSPLNGIPKKVTTKSLNSTDGEDVTSESDSISSVTGGDHQYFNKRAAAELAAQSSSSQQYQQQQQLQHQQQSHPQQHMMTHAPMLHQPHTAVLAQTTDMYGNVTNQNYIIFAPEVVYENVAMGMPMGAYPAVYSQAASGAPSSSASAPDATSASSQDNSMDPAASGYSTSPQFFYYPSTVPMYDAAQGAMAPHMAPVTQLAYTYQYYPQPQTMPPAQATPPMPLSTQPLSPPRRSGTNSMTLSPKSPHLTFQHQQPLAVDEHHLLVQAIRAQIEYYFSVQNLSRDYYLRGVMDEDGYVALGEINNFRRIRSMNANAQLIMEAIISSNQLDVMKSELVNAVLTDPATLLSTPESAILETKIRSVHDRSLWNSIPTAVDEGALAGRSSPPI